MSHELRTPLTSICGFAELMEHRLEQPRFREQAGLIRKAAEVRRRIDRACMTACANDDQGVSP
jgi:signal transduction histidine kinase